MSGLGNVIATAAGHRLLHTPTIAWTAYGGRNGTMIASGQRVVSGPEGHVTIEPESGRVLMVSTTLGEGPWSEIAAPVLVDPTGGYAPGVSACPGYSSSLVAQGAEVLMLAGTDLPAGRCEVRAGVARIGVQ